MRLPVLLLLLIVVAGNGGAQGRRTDAAGEAPAYAAAIATSRALVEELVRGARLPGVSVAVGVGEDVVWSEGFGWADVENRVAVTPLTRFRIGSVSKPITTAAMMRLVAAGRLDLDAPVRRHVPEFPDKGHPITARQLAGHLGGVRHYAGAEVLNTKHYDSAVDALEKFASDTLLHPPGTKYLYSSFGYNLLSAAIERAAGEPFLEVLARTVFEPLGMRSTGADHVDSIVPGRASFYRREDGALLNARYTDDSYKWASGGLLSTAEDLVRFGLGVLRGEMLDARARATMFTSQRTSAGDSTGYAMGWRPREDWTGRPVVHHGGTSEGGRAFLLVYPEQRVVVAMLSNFNPAPLFEQEAQTLAHFFLEHSHAGPDAIGAAGLIGSYQFETMVGRDSVSAVLRLTRSAAAPGSVSWGDSPALAIVAADTLHDGTLRLVGAGSQGVVNLWLRFDQSGFSGRWDWLGRTRDIRGRKVSDR